jgi:hypothetical protein
LGEQDRTVPMDKPKAVNLPIISTRGGALALEQIARTKSVLASLHGVDSAQIVTRIIEPEPEAGPVERDAVKDTAAG